MVKIKYKTTWNCKPERVSDIRYVPSESCTRTSEVFRVSDAVYKKIRSAYIDMPSIFPRNKHL